jgi:hypothetical protein
VVHQARASGPSLQAPAPRALSCGPRATLGTELGTSHGYFGTSTDTEGREGASTLIGGRGRGGSQELFTATTYGHNLTCKGMRV